MREQHFGTGETERVIEFPLESSYLPFEAHFRGPRALGGVSLLPLQGELTSCSFALREPHPPLSPVPFARSWLVVPVSLDA